MGGISIWQLLIILLIVLLLFGTKRLKSLGSDLGSAVKGFRGALSDAEKRDEDRDEQAEDTAVSAERRSAEGQPDGEGETGKGQGPAAKA